ncbi:MAG: ammonium transporter [Myxococcota bacterium]|nr:ammonium transporter [Myxococcota bacterium]
MNQAINAGDSAWILVSTALVLLMTPGVAFFYGGLVRGKNVLNTMMMSLFTMGLVSILWVVCGYSLAFGEGNAFIGSFEHVGLAGIGLGVHEGTQIPALLFVAFQMTFAAITPALISGAVVERMRFGVYCAFVVLWSLLVYAPLCKWVWGGGWIGEMGALDFAGGTVVHVSAGVSALVAALVLGERKTSGEEARPHNVPFVILGASLLWFGWFGFNGGSALAANSLAAVAILTTGLAAASAMVAWVAIEWKREGRPSAVGAMIGAVVGLVTITPAAGFVTPIGALCMGAIGSVGAYFSIVALAKFRVDDSLDVFACHGVGGIIGSILTGVFATTSVNPDGANGLLYGGGWSLVGIQTVGVVAAAVFAAVVTVVLFGVLKKTVGIRAADVEEEGGLDLTAHGEAAYVAEISSVESPVAPRAEKETA